MAARKSTKKKRKIEEKTAKPQETEKPQKPQKPQKTEAKKAAERFVEDLLVRGEAVCPDEHGSLPPGATHEIVEGPRDGKPPTPPKVRRRRFSMT